MAGGEKLNATLREDRGKRAVRRLRLQGQVPGVIYGHGAESVPLAVEQDELATVVRHGARVVDVEYNGNAEKALIRALQWDTFGQEILHFDLTRVAQDERIEIQVSIVLRGTPQGVKEGGVLEQTMHEAHVECLASNVPTELRVSVNDLGLDQPLHVRDLPLPAGVSILDDPDAMVANVKTVTEIVEEAPVTAEPELIGREADEQQEAE